MPDFFCRQHAGRVSDVIGGNLRGANSRQVARVAAVIAANDKHQIEPFLLEQRKDVRRRT